MSRQLLVDRVVHQGWTYAAAGEAAGVSRRTVGKWVQRFRRGGAAALADRSSRPGPPVHQTAASTVALIKQLRITHGLPAWALGRALQVPRSTVSVWLRRLGLQRRPTEPAAPVQRYEWPTAGDMIHLDIKRLGRFRQAGHRVHGDRQRCSPGAGWEYVHVAVDDHTRLALRRGPARAGRARVCRLPRPGDCLVSGARHHVSSPPHRQRQRVSVARLSGGLRGARPAPSAHAALHAAHQRQG
jgi:transposase